MDLHDEPPASVPNWWTSMNAFCFAVETWTVASLIILVRPESSVSKICFMPAWFKENIYNHRHYLSRLISLTWDETAENKHFSCFLFYILQFIQFNSY